MTTVLRLLIFLAVLSVSPAWAQSRDNPSDGLITSHGQMATGALPFDPSKNVLDLVEAAIRRQDDLRSRLEASVDGQLKLINELSNMRSQHDRELLQANTYRLDSEARLRAEFAEKIAATEKARVDAIRQVDKAAVDQTASVATLTATNLAKTQTETAGVLSAQVAKSAEDVRNLVATTAAESNRNIQQQFSAISTRIAALEQGSAQGVGEHKFSDPATILLADQVRALVKAQEATSGISSGSSTTWLTIIAVVTLLALVGGVIIAFVSMNRKVAANGVPQGG